MTITDTERAIILGAGPRGLAAGTVALAVEAADRLDLDIEVVHVLPTLAGWPTGTIESGLALEQLGKAGRAALEKAVEQVRAAVDGRHAVSPELIHGGVVDGLVGRSVGAKLVILERHAHPRWERWTAGETTSQVAARAHAPVVVVPPDWQPSSGVRPISVGCEDGPRAAAELWTALGLAAATDRPVRVVRATYLAEAYQEILRREAREQDFLDGARADLLTDAAPIAEACPGVTCTFEARWGHPADVLVDLTTTSSLLVIARRNPRVPFGSHLGPVVRQVLSQAHCPVMVVEPRLREPVEVAQRPTTAVAG
jgi:nucleotide-binding universal stress UspA family protein